MKNMRILQSELFPAAGGGLKVVELFFAGVVLVGVVGEEGEGSVGVFAVFCAQGDEVAVAGDVGVGEVLALGEGPVGAAVDFGGAVAPVFEGVGGENMGFLVLGFGFILSLRELI